MTVASFKKKTLLSSGASPYVKNYCVSAFKLVTIIFMVIRTLNFFSPLESSSSFGHSLLGTVPWSYRTESKTYNSPLNVSILKLEIFARPKDFPPTLGFFDHLASRRCAYRVGPKTAETEVIKHSLPNATICLQCVKQQNCVKCHSQCQCFCKSLCQDSVRYDDKKFVSKRITVIPPVRTNEHFDNGRRLIPKIIHQTYYEEITHEKYPIYHGFVESWKGSGWEYRFYNNSQAEEFLSLHFPPEVRQAFKSLNHGAFKADLFRYCALLIHGGIYADVDTNRTSDLDLAIPRDVGFAVPIANSGAPRSCLWNGFMAAAPAHPYLATAIEMSVNNIRNRYNTVDITDRLCPMPKLSELWNHDIYSVTGPFLLGMAINTVHETSAQAPFAAGTLDRPNGGLNGYGRTIILNKGKDKTSPNRIKPKSFFDNDNKSIIWAQTDLAPSENKRKHYSKASMAEVYVDNVSSDEVIRISVYDEN